MRKREGPKVFVLSGAASGVGAATERLLTAPGEFVMLADINIAGARHVAASLGPGADAVELDITSPEAWEHALDATISRFGRLEVLTSNAAIVVTGYARDAPLEHDQRAMGTDFMRPLAGDLDRWSVSTAFWRTREAPSVQFSAGSVDSS